MPNGLLCTLLLALASGSSALLSAQEKTIDLPDPAAAPQPRLIVLSGIAAEGSTSVFQTFFLLAERPCGPYRHLGLQYTTYLSDSNYGFYNNLRKGSYELGVFSKFFLHGRLSGRRSHLYYGPQLRFGVRKLIYSNNYPSNGSLYNYRTNTAKVLFCIGGQYTLGRAVFEWSLPLGVEYTRSNLSANLDPYGYYGIRNGRHFTTLPGVALGFRL